MPILLRPTRADMRAMVTLATPIVGVWVGTMLMGVVDTIMVGHYSSQALAAVALGNFYYFTIAVFGLGVLFALDPLISQAIGAKDPDTIRRAVQQGLTLALLLGVPSALLVFAGGPVLRALRQPADALPGATTYLQITSVSVVAIFVFTALRQTLQAMKRVAPIVIAMVVANLLNAALNWVLIFGKLGAPTLGITGAALATLISRVATVLLVLALAWDVLRPYVSGWLRAKTDWPAMRGMIKLGLPIGAQQELEVAAFSFMMLLMGWIGTIELAAHQVALNLASFTFMIPLGVGSAASVLVGHAVGAGDEDGARRAAAAGLVWGVGFMALSAMVFLAMPRMLARVYSDDAAVLALAATLIPIAGVFQVFDGTQVVGLGVLRGVADTRTPMAIALVGYWLIGMPAGAWLAFRGGMGARGVWWGAVIGLGAVAIMLLWRVRSRFRRRLARVELEPAST